MISFARESAAAGDRCQAISRCGRSAAGRTASVARWQGRRASRAQDLLYVSRCPEAVLDRIGSIARGIPASVSDRPVLNTGSWFRKGQFGDARCIGEKKRVARYQHGAGLRRTKCGECAVENLVRVDFDDAGEEVELHRGEQSLAQPQLPGKHVDGVPRRCVSSRESAFHGTGVPMAASTVRRAGDKRALFYLFPALDRRRGSSGNGR